MVSTHGSVVPLAMFFIQIVSNIETLHFWQNQTQEKCSTESIVIVYWGFHLSVCSVYSTNKSLQKAAWKRSWWMLPSQKRSKLYLILSPRLQIYPCQQQKPSCTCFKFLGLRGVLKRFTLKWIQCRNILISANIFIITWELGVQVQIDENVWYESWNQGCNFQLHMRSAICTLWLALRTGSERE